LFLRAADILVSEGILKERRGGQNFTQQNTSGPIASYPNYEVDDDIAHLMKQTFWELYIQGVLAPASNFRAIINEHNQEERKWVSGGLFLDLDHIMLTPYGVDILIDSKNRIRVYDPDGYLANFWSASPLPDPIMMRYLSECNSVFRSGHLLASVILLGIASERLVNILAERLRDALGNPMGSEWFRTKYKGDISDRFKALTNKLVAEYDQELKQEKLRDALEGVVTLTFAIIRHARNDIAHPKGRDFTWNEVSGFLHSFVQYFKYVNRIIELLANNPK
jgi:hypothetical protein